MDVVVEGEFLLEEFSPQSLVYVPELNCVLTSNGCGEVASINVVTGQIRKYQDVPGSRRPFLLGYHAPSGKVIVSCGGSVGARRAFKDTLLLRTILQQPPKNKTDDVTIEIPAAQVPSLLKELQKYSPRPSLNVIQCHESVLRQLSAGYSAMDHPKASSCTFTGNIDKLYSMFSELHGILKGQVTSTPGKGLKTKPSLPLIAGLAFRLLLLHPDHQSRLSKAEEMVVTTGIGDNNINHVEALRRLSLIDWPHTDYKWAVPHTMAQAGFFRMANSQGVNVVGNGDRVTCFACRVFLYSWEPSDEPWSEHERHALQCPYIRGESTDNVPITLTDASHPAIQITGEEEETRDEVICLGISHGSQLVAVGTESGRIVLLDLSCRLTVLKRTSVELTSDLVDQWLQDDSLGSGLEDPAVALSQGQASSVSTGEEAVAEDIACKEEEEEEEERGSRRSTLTREDGGDCADKAEEANGEEDVDSRNRGMDDGPGQEGVDGSTEVEEVKRKLDSEVPVSKHQVRITSLCLLKQSTSVRVKPPAGAANLQPTKTAAYATTAASTGAVSDMEARKAAQTPCSILLTGVTKTVVQSSRRVHVPLLIIHHCLEDTHQRSHHKPGVGGASGGGGGGGDGSLTPVTSQSMSMSILQSMGSLENDIPNVVTSSMFARESSVMLDVAGVFPLKDMTCSEGSGCIPQISQILPLDDGNLLAVSCQTWDSANNRPCSFLVLYQITSGPKVEVKVVGTDSFRASRLRICAVDPLGSSCGIGSSHDSIDDMVSAGNEDGTPERRTMLLACLASSGEVRLHDCSVAGLKQVGSAHCSPSTEERGKDGDGAVEEEFTHCLFCPTTSQLVVTTRSGKLLTLRVSSKKDGEGMRANEEDKEVMGTYDGSSDSAIDWSLDEEDLDQLLNLVRTSSRGVPITCTCPVDWSKTSVEQVNRKSPLHVNPPPEQTDTPSAVPTCTSNCGPQGMKNSDNSVILQYQAPLLATVPSRYEFEVAIDSTGASALGSVCVRLTFANMRCISSDATISLLVAHCPTKSRRNNGICNLSKGESPSSGTDHHVLCGPVRLKPLIDVTEQSLQVVFVHPRLLDLPCRTLILAADNLFSSEYNSVAYYEDSVAGGGDAASRRQAWRNRAFRHQVHQSSADTTGSFPVNANLLISVYPLFSPADSLSSSPIRFDQLAASIHDTNFLLRLTVCACSGQVEDGEMRALPESLQSSIREGLRCSESMQLRALDLLLWTSLVHAQNGEREAQGYSVICRAVGQLLLSLMHACYVKGTRILAHKCSRLLVMLYRGDLDESSDSLAQFRFTLSGCFTRVLPLLPVFSAAACVHWFLRMVAMFTGACDACNSSSICMQLLVDLARVLSTKQALPAQILQTHFKHESSIFEADLFDIYLSYCQKSNTATLVSKSKGPSPYHSLGGSYAPPSAYTYVSPTDSISWASSGLSLSNNQPGIALSIQDLQAQFEGVTVSSVPPVPKTSAVGQDGTVIKGVPPGTTHVVADKTSHTIYDYELQLLLDSSKKRSTPEATGSSNSDSNSSASSGTNRTSSKTILDFPTYKHGSFLLYNQRGLLETLPLSYTCVSVTGNATVLEPSIYTLHQMPEPHPPQQGLGVGSVSKTSGYKYPSLSSSSATNSRRGSGTSILDRDANQLSASSATPTPMPQILANISPAPKELVMQVESLKSGVAYSAVIKFIQPVLLTDLSIPCTNTMSSVSVDVWLDPADEATPLRVAQSSDVKTKSLMLGMLSPPPPCQYVKVTFLGSLVNSREPADILIGSFYGIPLLSPDVTPSAAQLRTLEEQLLTQYYLYRDSLSSALLSYYSHHGNPSGVKRCEDRVNYDFQQCFKMQVCLARLRGVIRHLKSSEEHSRVFQLSDGSSVDYSLLSVSKLSKLIGTLLNTALSLNFGVDSESWEENFDLPAQRNRAKGAAGLGCEPQADGILEDEGLEEDVEWGHGQLPILSEEDCRVLFLMLCIHGTPQMHARAIALLINFGGSQKWWGRFVVNMMRTLFDGQQTDVFNKERALLQLSALCLHTYNTSDLLPCLLNFLLQLLSPFLPDSTSSSSSSSPPPPHPSRGDTEGGVLQWVVLLLTHFLSSVVLPSSQSNLFVPLTVPMASEASHDVPSASAERDYKSRTAQERVAADGGIYRSMRRTVTEYQTIPPPSSSAPQAPPSTSDDKPIEPLDEVLARLPQDLCHSVIRGLVRYVLALCSSDGNASFTPVVSKCVSLLLCSTKWCYPLHTLLSQDDLRNLLQSASFSITPSDKPTVTASLELQRGMLQSVFSALLFYGEVWPCVCYAKAIKQHGKDEAKSKGTHTKSAMEYPSSKEPAKDLSKVETIPYNTFIISNTLEYRNRTNPESVAELHLQKVARAIYGSVLLALVHAKPLAQQEEHDPDQIEEGAETSILKDKFLQRQSSCDMLIFPETLSMLVSSIEELLKKAAAYHQLLNETDILAVLSLWHRCNAVLTGRSKPPSTSGEEKSKKRTEHKVVYVVTSETCFYILVDFLLAQTSISPAVWQTALICILGNLRSKCTLEYDQLLELLVKFFLSTSSAVDHGLVQRIMATLLPLSLHSARHEDTLSGACLLLEILVATLQKRGVLLQGCPMVLELCQWLRTGANVKALWTSSTGSGHLVLDLVHSFCEHCTEILPDALSGDCFPGVELFGGELDDTAKRKHYYNLPTDLYKYSWNRTLSDSNGSSSLANDLLQLLVAIFESDLSVSTQESIQQYCLYKFGTGSSELNDTDDADYLKLSDSSARGLVLIFADSPLLLKFLQIFNLVSAQSGKTKVKEVSVYHKFIVFMYNSCKDPACFFEPIQHILNSSPTGSRFSNHFMSLITWDSTFLTKQEDGQKQATDFILSGGGKVILKCLMDSAPRKQGSGGGGLYNGHGLSGQVISKLGVHDVSLKTINPSSNLVNFYRIASYSIQSIKGVRRLAPPTGEIRSSTYFFMHSFMLDEKCVKLHVSFPYPILVYNFIFLVMTEAGGKTSGIPSKLCIHSSVHTSPESLVPVTPVFETAGLKIINVAFHQPLLTRRMTVYFYRSCLHPSVAVSKMEILGTPYGSSAEAIGVGAKPLLQQEKDGQGSGWMDIVDKWLGSAVTAAALKSLFGAMPDLLPNSLVLLATPTTKKFKYQLENLLLALADCSPDAGTTILCHLMGFSSTGQVSDMSNTADSSFSFRLLTELCTPTTDVCRQRLSLALRLLSNLDPSQVAAASHLPFLACALSNIIWNGKRMGGICSAETFHSLVELAFSLDPHLQYKRALNTLLCSLCYTNLDYFSMLLSSCDNVLVNDVSTASRLLSTLAQCAKSLTCSTTLFKSDLMSQMISRLTNGFEKLLDLLYQPVSEDAASGAEEALVTNARDSLTYLCTLLAFFTDFVRNWMPGKLWMAKEANHRFWSPMLRFLSMDTSVVSPHEVAFVQEVAFDFFNVCLLACSPTKVAFVRLVCAVLCEKHILTQFIHRMLIGLVFRHDSVPVIIRLVVSDPRKEASQALSLPLTYETQDYHPSHPIGDSCYILYIPLSSNLAKLDSIIKSHRVNKPLPVSTAKVSDRIGQRRAPKAASSEESSSLPAVITGDMDNFDIKGWKDSEISKENLAPPSTYSSTINKTMLYCAAVFEEKDALNCNSLTTYIRHWVSGTIFSADVRLKHVCPRNACGDYPLTAVMDSSAILFNADHAVMKKGVDMFNLFVSCKCLQPLADCLPSLYSYHWPNSLRTSMSSASNSCGSGQTPDVIPRGILRPHIVLNPPSAIPFHSLLMLGLCLQLDQYGVVMGGNPSGAFMLMRLLLGNGTKESLPKVSTEFLSCIPYLLFRWTLRKSPGHSKLGQRLRARVHELGILLHLLQCLANSSHQPPRIDLPEGGGAKEGSTTTSHFDSVVQPKKVGSSIDRQYWAKGTGFGTGSTISSYTMHAVRAKHQLEEKYVSICFAILAEFLSVEDKNSGENGDEANGAKVKEGERELEAAKEGMEGEEVRDGEKEEKTEDFCSVEVVELLCRSCLLPSLASCLLNDSVLDISKHVELYNSALSVLSAMATNPSTQHLLTLPVFSPGWEGGASGGVTSLASLLAKLREVALIYQKTARLNEKEKTPSRKTVNFEADEAISKPKIPPPILRKPTKYPAKEIFNEETVDDISGDEGVAERDQLLSSEEGSNLKTDLVTSSEIGDVLKPIISTVTEEMAAQPPKVNTEENSAKVHLVPDTGSDTESSATTATAAETPTIDTDMGGANVVAPVTTALAAAGDSHAVSNETASANDDISAEGSSSSPDLASIEISKAFPALIDKDSSTMLTTVDSNMLDAAIPSVPSKSPAPVNKIVTVVASGDGVSSPNTVGSHTDSFEEVSALVNLFQEPSETKPDEKKEESMKVEDGLLEAAGTAADVVSSDEGSSHSKTELASTQEAEEEQVNVDLSEEEEEAAAVLVTDILKKFVKQVEVVNGKNDSTGGDKAGVKFVPLPDLPPPIPPRAPIAPKKKLYALRRKPPKPSYKDNAVDKVEVVAKILSVSAQVAEVVLRLKEECGSFSRQGSISTPLTDSAEGAGAAYMTAMKPLQFETYQLVEEDETGKLTFLTPFHYQTQVESATSAVHNPARSRRLAQEISTLASSLPLSPSSSVFVRCDEERLDMMKVLITGPSETPYANGCFEFDVFFPPDYPKGPMLINLKTTGHGRVRFNPNLYNDGKVCLSVLNTWHGRPEEKWNAQTSSFLQVLVSIQSLILVPEPYFNEPGYEQSRGTAYGDQKSLAYNSNIEVATIQWAMISQIRNPTPCFKKVILHHFIMRKEPILSQCEVWKRELEEALRRTKSGDPSLHVLKDHLHSLAVSIQTLKVELDKLKEDDFQDDD